MTTDASQTGRWVLLATILASSMAFIDGSALNVALPSIQDDLNATGPQLVWIVNAYALLLAALILIGGVLGDRLGRKKIFMAGIGLFSAASLACGLAPNAQILIAMRAIQGIGGALMVPGSLAIISAYFPSDERGKAIGTWSSFSTITTALGPILGGFLASQGLWRVVFFINLPLAIIALYALVTHVPESRNTAITGKIDYPGTLLVTLGLAGITFGLTEGTNYGWGAPLILISLLGGLVVLIAFIFVESRSTNPIVPLHLFKSRTFSGANLLTLFLYGALTGALFFFPLNLIQVQDYPSEIAAFALMPFVLLLSVLSRWAGGLVDRYGPRLPLTIGPALTGIGFLILSLPGLTSGPEDYFTSFLPAILVIGLGMSITVAPLTTAVMVSVSSHRAGTASGINNAVARSAGVLALALLGAVALASFSSALDHHSENIALSAAERDELDDEAANLGDAKPPAHLGSDIKKDVEHAIRLAFVDMFRLNARITAISAWLSALFAFFVVEKRISPIEEK